MPLLFGPKNSRYANTGSPCPHNDLAFEVEALNLRGAIKQYEANFNVSIASHRDSERAIEKYGEKYFLHTDNQTGIACLVDIHILRAGIEICPKQNLEFELLPTDLVELGELIC